MSRDNPATVNAYFGDWLPPKILGMSMPPEFVVLPNGTMETQAVIKICNRYKIPFIPVGSNQWSLTGSPNRPHTVIIDCKRMGEIHEIDEKNMYAVIEPLCTLAQVQAEAYKRGLYIGSPEASATASAIGGHVFQGMWGVGYRLGVAYRNILGIEWVLPNGEILRTGSFSQDADNGFWGEGPGPDLRGMLRGYAGAMGGVGMVTKMAVKLHPYPGPKVWPVEGIIPNQTSMLPEDRFKWYMVKYESLEDAINFMYEVGKAEIARRGAEMADRVLYHVVGQLLRRVLDRVEKAHLPGQCQRMPWASASGAFPPASSLSMKSACLKTSSRRPAASP